MTKRIVTLKQHLILLLLYCFRFLNSKQIQEFLGHKDHRRINAWLKDLTNKGYIERDFQPVFGTLTKPAIYSLSALGRKHIKQSFSFDFPKYLKRISRDNKASKSFRIRCQLLADFYLTVKPPKTKEFKKETDTKPGIVEQAKPEKIEEATKTKQNKESEEAGQSRQEETTGIAIIDTLKLALSVDITNRKYIKPQEKTLEFFTPAYFPDFDLLEMIKPDGYMRSKTRTGAEHGLVFVLDAYIPRFLLRYSVRKIFDCLDESDLDSDETIRSLQIYYLCPNNQIIIYLKRLIPSFLDRYYGKELIFKLATRNQMYKWKDEKLKQINWTKLSSEDEYDN